ncbi:MAG: hypothetical protein ACYTGX_08900 [Planctomycetota bacterium]
MRMRVSSTVLLALLAATPVAPAQERPGEAAPAGESPIEFIVGNQVVTRAEVRRPISERALTDPAERRRLYENVRRQLAQDWLLYQYAQRRGVNVTADQINRVVDRERRQHASGRQFALAIQQLHGSLDAYKELVKRKQTIGQLQARAAYGPELSASPPTAPERILFSSHRQRAILDRCDEAAEHMARTVPGELYVLNFSGRAVPDVDAVATEFAALWRKGQDAAAIRAELDKRKLTDKGVSFEPIVLEQEGWRTEVYDPEAATALYRAISAMKPGDVSNPVALGSARYVLWLKSVPTQSRPDPERVQSSIAMSLSSERAAELQSMYVREALKTTFVWPEALKRELLAKNAKK